MARKERKQNFLLPKEEVTKKPKRIYKVDAYVRLSVEDSGKSTSDSIENQKTILLDYIESQSDMELHALYCDNGESGVTFNRLGFECVMENLKNGVSDCMVVKDLSRFGRNYIETGNYLEHVFPFLGIRFVSVTDHFDTLTAQWDENGYIIPLKNLINHIYAQDISRKISSALEAKQKNGDFIGSLAAYGYRKDLDNKNHLLVDEVAAPVVKSIFEWFAQGISICQIIRNLETQEIPSPGQYHYANGMVKSKRFATSHWNYKTIKDMLIKEVYLGHMVQRKQRASLFEGQPKIKLPKEQWIIVRNTHEAIITQKLFDAVQSVLLDNQKAHALKQKKYADIPTTENLLKGLLFCGECGTALIRHKVVRMNKCKEPKHHVWYQYVCPCHAVHPDHCNFTSIKESYVNQAVFLTLQGQFTDEKVLTRDMVLELLENITVTQEGILSITPKYCDEYLAASKVMEEQVVNVCD